MWVVGYSWGSQTWGMISSYVRFGRVICTSGPQAEGFPNADWILKPGPNRTPPDRQFTLLTTYPSVHNLWANRREPMHGCIHANPLMGDIPVASTARMTGIEEDGDGETGADSLIETRFRLPRRVTARI